MIKETYETKTYVKTESVLVSEKLYCDICGKEITGPHWSVMTGHHDWGNDSVDSVQHKDACSGLCLDRLFKEYVIKSSKDDGAFNTEYIEIYHERTSGVRGKIEYNEKV